MNQFEKRIFGIGMAWVIVLVAVMSPAISSPMGNVVLAAESNMSEQYWNEIQTTAGPYFPLGKDNNSFINSNDSTWDGAGFKGVTDYSLDDTYFEKLTKNSSKSEKNKIKKKMKKSWSGSCYGIALSMGLLYEDYIDLKDLTDSKNASNYYSMPYPADDSKLLNMITYYQLSQNLKKGGKKSSTVSVAYNNSIFTKLVNWLCDYDSLSVFLNKLVNYSDSDRIALLGYTTSDDSHAVLVTGCRYNSSIEKYILRIYDENSVVSATSIGNFSYMTIEKDFSAFSYTDANGNKITNKFFSSIYFLDWSKLGNIASTSTTTLSEHTKLDFLLGDDFKAINDDGKYIQYTNNEFAGDMNIYSFDTVDSDDGTHIIIETDKTDKLTLSDTGTKVNVELYNDDQFLALDGENISGAVLDLGDGIKISGDDYSFKAYISTDEIQNNEDGLISISAKASADTTVSKNNSDIEVSSTDILTDIESGNYSGTDLDVTTYSDSSEINVKAEEQKDTGIEQILLNKTSISMNVNDTFALVAEIQPLTITNYTLQWKSSDTKVATVTNDGVIKGVATGTATITVESNGVSAQCLVTVKNNSVSVSDSENIEQITLNKTSISMNVNDTFALIAGIQPLTITNYTLQWKSSDTKVATVTNDGVIKGVATGTAMITVESNGVSAQCLVTVENNGNSVSNDEQTSSSKTSIKGAKVTLKKSVYTYDGKKKQPSVTVKIGNTTLTKNVQYKVAYKDNKNIGNASITITGIGSYEGSFNKRFTIVPKGTSILKLSAKKKGTTLIWKKQAKNTSGYQIQYSTSNKFTSKATKSKLITKSKNTKATISKLKGNKKYYVRIRTYKTVKGKKYYSSWSKVKKVTTKK